MSSRLKDAYPLLLTGTIDSGVYSNIGNRIQDVQTRLAQYESAISRYIEQTPFTHIVFIENSGYPFDAARFEKMAREQGKEFEFICGKICREEVLRYGKSFGDAYLMHEALEKSRLLRDQEMFYKITGRIFLKNAKAICKTKNKYRNEFIVYAGIGWCMTFLFKANKEDFLRVFDDAYTQCDETAIRDIEITFYKKLAESDLSVGSFHVYPYFDGVMGATGRNYSGKLPERILRNIMARLHCFAYGSGSSKLVVLAMKLLKKGSYL